MKNLFSGYYKLTKEEFKTLWENAVFIFDTNVMLNLYRYQSSTRDSLFSVIEQLDERVWVPYHVGLEFQRNRLKVIAAQHKRYSEVQNIVSKSVSGMESELDGLQLKKRHSHIDPDKLIKGVKIVETEFLKELNALEEKSISTNSTDTIRLRIDELFEGKVGDPPANQKIIERLFEEAEIRYKNSIPPGFKDSKKDEKSPDEFSYGGITYKRKYGDLIIWKQLIDYAKKESLKDIIFVTDDSKSDWWWKIDSNGKKTIGVRPELRDELGREAGVERFYLYNTEGFLNYANEQLGTQVTKEAIEEVREVSVSHINSRKDYRSVRQLSISTEQAVFEWLMPLYPGLEENRKGHPDFVAYNNGRKYGFEIKLIRESRMIMHRLQEMMYRSYYMLNEESFFEMVLIFVVLDENILSKVTHQIRRKIPEMENNLRIFVGKAEIDEEEALVYGFTPYDEIHADKSL